MFLRRAALALPLLLGGCAPKTPGNSISTPAPATNSSSRNAPSVSRFDSPADDLGRAIALKAPARRVIVIGPGAIETIFALGAQKSLVGRDDYADFPPAAKKIAIAGNYQGPNVEQSVALQPDLVIVQGETWDKARVEQWQSQIGAPVAALVATDVRGVQNDIAKIGKWLGQSAKIAQIAAPLLPKNGAAAPKRTAFIEIGRSPLYTAGAKTLVADAVLRGGWSNVARVTGYQPYGIESLLAAQPDAYIVTSKAPRAVVLQQLRGSSALSKLKCVRDGRVVVVDGDLLLRPGPRLGQGIARLRAEATRLASQLPK